MSKALFPTRCVLWLPLDYPWQPPSPSLTHCCEEMTAALDFDCDTHTDPFDCCDTLIVYHEIFNEYGLPIRNGGESYLLISHCPFCARQLPESGRDAWFDKIEAMGLDEKDYLDLPEHFKTGAWRKPQAS